MAKKKKSLVALFLKNYTQLALVLATGYLFRNEKLQ
jgi:hypothetical protein